MEVLRRLPDEEAVEILLSLYSNFGKQKSHLNSYQNHRYGEKCHSGKRKASILLTLSIQSLIVCFWAQTHTGKQNGRQFFLLIEEDYSRKCYCPKIHYVVN